MWRRRRPRRRRNWRPRAIRRCASPSGSTPARPMSGSWGSRDRLSYTCVGDTVTLAARLEGLTRSYGVSNCVGPEAAAACPPGLRAIVLDRIAAKGFAQAVDVSLIVPAGAEAVADFAEVLSRARMAYLGRDWDVAEAAFTELAQQTPALLRDAACRADLSRPHRLAPHEPARTGLGRRGGGAFPNGEMAFWLPGGRRGRTETGSALLSVSRAVVHPAGAEDRSSIISSPPSSIMIFPRHPLPPPPPPPVVVAAAACRTARR